MMASKNLRSLSSNYDVIIVGGGMVGLSVAAGLLEAGYRVAVVDTSPLTENFSKEPEARVSALTRVSENWLKASNAWQKIPSERLSPYQQMKVWDAQGEGRLNFTSLDLAEPNLGHIVENSVIRTALYIALKSYIESEQLKTFSPVKAKRVCVDLNEVTLELGDGINLTGKLIVAADGANSWLRKQLAFSLDSEPYQQSALVALVESQTSHQATAWQRFLPSGPLAFLPMKQKNHHSIVWSLSEEFVNELVNCKEEEFLGKLEVAVESQFGSLKLLSKRAAFPLIARHASSYIQHRCVLVGDAAHTIHPLAGQGVNLGFLDAKVLVDILSSNRSDKIDPGSKKYLREYERQRKGDNHQVQKAMTVIKQVFGSEQQTVVELRNNAMSLINNNLWLKKQLIQRAMGLY